ncbi:MAG: flagellar hook-basal body complex protein FliE [Chitinivibrionales bacterium]|nr:flagellar hook-basal body complex protein FliE [Chitinivibrionales bacterium]
MRINGIEPGHLHEISRIQKRIAPQSAKPSFKDTLATFLNDVNTSQKVAGKAKEKFLAGEITDVHQVTSKSGEAKVAFNMLMEIRNKVLDGYNEIMRMRL